MKKYLLILTSIFILTIISTTYSQEITLNNHQLEHEDKNITINGITFTIPYEYQNGTITDVKYGESNYKLNIKNSYFRIWVYSNINNPNTYVGYTLIHGKNIQELNISNHPAVVTFDNTTGTQMARIFLESSEKLIQIETPCNNNLTDKDIKIISSIPDSTLSGKELENNLLAYITQYEEQQLIEESSYSNYYDGYSYGSKSGYHKGYNSGFSRGVFTGIFASNLMK